MRSREHLTKLLQTTKNLNTLSSLHSLLLRSGLLTSQDCFFATRLTSAYSKAGLLHLARRLFDEIPHPNIFLYNAILRAHCAAAQWPQALRLFSSVPRPDAFTLSVALKACAALRDLPLGRAVHGLVVRTPMACFDMFVGAALVQMYSKFGQMVDAVAVFDGFLEPDVVLRSAVVSGFQQNGNAEEAVSFFLRAVVGDCVVPDPITLVSVVSALVHLGDLHAGRSCHGYLIRMGFDSDLSLVNSVLNLYAKLGAVGATRKLFDGMPRRDVITWTSMISCLAQNGYPEEALDVYKMMTEAGIEANAVTLLSVVQACALSLNLDIGRTIHELVFQRGYLSDLAVATALIDMYMKCSCYAEALDLFHKMAKKDVVSWSAIIGGYAQNGLANKSLEVFLSMLSAGFSPDAVTLVKVLTACSQLGVLHQTLCLHGYLVNTGFNNTVFVSSALLDAYAKCGSLDSAVKVFESATVKDVVLWSSMIAAYGVHGLGHKAIATFEHMTQSSVRPNSITFVSMLSSCSHAGLVEEGKFFFNSMSNVYGLVPTPEHFGIVIDLLARSGELEEALMLIKHMPTNVGPHVWCALLAGCTIHHNVHMAEMVARNLLDIEPRHAAYYNLISNIYAVDGKWDKMVGLKSLVNEKGLRKTPGYSSIEINNEVHTFLAGDKVHRECNKIYMLLKELNVNMRDLGDFADRYHGMPISLESPFMPVNYKAEK